MTIRPAAAAMLVLLASAPGAGAQDQTQARTQTPAWVDFGDNSGRWAMDGICDDPRFQDEYGYVTGLDDHRGRDAADCRAAWETGRYVLREDIINFGDDYGRMARDGVCDDPRFEGPGMRPMLFGDHRGQDGTDCRAAWDAGTVSLRADGIVFGDDAAESARDGRCDDARFRGPGMADPIPRGLEGRDATDCRAAFLGGLIEPVARQGLYGPAVASIHDGVDFGDNSSVRAHDGLCDDPRFEGPGMSPEDDLSPADAGRDMSDCASAWIAETVVLREGAEPRLSARD